MKKLLPLACLCLLLITAGCGPGEKGPIDASEVKPADPQMIQNMMQESMKHMGKNVPVNRLPTEAPKQ